MRRFLALAALALYDKFPLDVFKDLMPISLVGQFDCLMVASASSEFKSLADFLKAGRAKPGGWDWRQSRRRR